MATDKKIIITADAEFRGDLKITETGSLETSVASKQYVDNSIPKPDDSTIGLHITNKMYVKRSAEADNALQARSDGLYVKPEIPSPSRSGVILVSNSERKWVETNYSDKQDKLVSGSNIKTINGNSVLGSGDLSVEAECDDITTSKNSDGSIQVNISNLSGNKLETRSDGLFISSTGMPEPSSDGQVLVSQNNEWIEQPFSAKQDKLVSGTNIKTINGQTLLGSSDITIETKCDDSTIAKDENDVIGVMISSETGNAIQSKSDGLFVSSSGGGSMPTPTGSGKVLVSNDMNEWSEQNYNEKQDTIQVSVLPQPSSQLSGSIYQYTGEQTLDLISGHFYRCQTITKSNIAYGNLTITSSQLDQTVKITGTAAGWYRINNISIKEFNSGTTYVQLSQGDKLEVMEYSKNTLTIEYYTLEYSWVDVSGGSMPEPTSDNLVLVSNDGEWVEQDYSNKQDIIQLSEFPEATLDRVGTIYQYVGTTDSSYKNGHFYRCSQVSDLNIAYDGIAFTSQLDQTVLIQATYRGWYQKNTEHYVDFNPGDTSVNISKGDRLEVRRYGGPNTITVKYYTIAYRWIEVEFAADLSNYYTKSETDAIIAAIRAMNLEVVETLPTHDISNLTIYLVPKAQSSQGDVYDEYLYINSQWEHVGSTQVDLSNYYTKTQTYSKAEVDTNIANSKTKVDEATIEYNSTDKLEVQISSLSGNGLEKKSDGLFVQGSSMPTPTGEGKVLVSNGNNEWSEQNYADKQNILQFDVLPSPSQLLIGKIYQYVGQSTSGFATGAFYQCSMGEKLNQVTAITPSSVTAAIFTSDHNQTVTVVAEGSGGWATVNGATVVSSFPVGTKTISVNQGDRVEIRSTGSANILHISYYTVEPAWIIIQNGTNSNVYSTSEVAIGKWIDGKTIYRKVYENVALGNSTAWHNVLDISSLNIDFITNFFGVWKESGGMYNIPVYMSSGYYVVMRCTPQYVQVQNAGFTVNIAKIILEYTKVS